MLSTDSFCLLSWVVVCLMACLDGNFHLRLNVCLIRMTWNGGPCLLTTRLGGAGPVASSIWRTPSQTPSCHICWTVPQMKRSTDTMRTSGRPIGTASFSLCIQPWMRYLIHTDTLRKWSCFTAKKYISNSCLWVGLLGRIFNLYPI